MYVIPTWPIGVIPRPALSTDADSQYYNIGFHQYLDSFELVTHRLVGGDCSGAGDGRHRPWTPASQTITG